MKPLMLNGHSRALTQIKFNTEGDLLFSASKDATPCVWFSHNGERLGTYDGHNGTVWSVDPSWNTEMLLTGSADNTCKIWNVETGVCKATFDTASAVRSVNWSYSGRQFMYSTDKAMKKNSEIYLYDWRAVEQEGSAAKPYLTIPSLASKVSSALWGPADETVITGHENGTINIWCARTGENVGHHEVHKGLINDMQYSKDQSYFITASKDCVSKTLDTSTMEVLKQFKTERPVNSASISPLRDHVVLGGGQDAMSVTTSSAKVGKFDARFYHLIFEEEIGRVKGHFGPINTVAFQPDGQGFASGGEDGYIRIHHFDPSYFAFDFEH